MIETDTLYALTRECKACQLREGCKGVVPAVGQGRIMLVGEAPGKNEDSKGQPFTGDAGSYLNSLLDSIGIKRKDVIITNTVKCRPLRNRTPSRDEAEFCGSRWLDMEINLYKPEIVVGMGKVAIERFLGNASVEHIHGIPQSITHKGHSFTFLPVYHPAAGFYDSALMRAIAADFAVLGRLVEGETVSHITDDLVPTYLEWDGPDLEAFESITAIDTEIVDGKLWSYQVSSRPGTGMFVDADKAVYIPGDKGAVVHNYLFDSQWIELPEFCDDTMVMAYLLGLPQGLKELSWRLCGMEMSSYTETIAGYRKTKAMDYLDRAASLDLDVLETPELENVTWDKKENMLKVQMKKPQHISKKIKRIIADVIGGKVLKSGPVDPWARWHQIDARERAEVEALLGPMPDASLADIPRDQAIYYSTRDADATLRVYLKLWDMLKEQDLGFVYHMDQSTLPVAQEMQTNGIAVDEMYLRNLGRHYLEQMEAKAEEIFSALNGLRFNPNSDHDLRKVFYEDLGNRPTKYTPTGLPSVRGEELSKIKHPAAKLVEEYRHLAHLKDSFCDALPSKISEDGRIHTTINITRTETGRWSMKNPNLQQIPSRSEQGRAIRKAFIAGNSTSLVAIDYSQIEMRVAAHLAQCQSMIDMFKQGRDIHTETASQIFGIPIAEVTSQHRYPTKTMGFGVIYGLTAHGLQNQMQLEGLTDWSETRCAEFIQWYYSLRPELRAWQEYTKAKAQSDGFVRDMFGRIRYIPELLCPIERYRGAGERQAVNMPVQSSAQGILKLSMGLIHRNPEVPFLWLLQVHDELMFEVADRDLGRFVRWAKFAMESVVHLSVPVIAEAKAGKNWGEMEDVEVYLGGEL